MLCCTMGNFRLDLLTLAQDLPAAADYTDADAIYE